MSTSFIVRNPSALPVTLTDIGIIVAGNEPGLNLSEKSPLEDLFESTSLQSAISGGSLIRVVSGLDVSIADTFKTTPFGLTDDIIYALHGANTPTASNVFATFKDILPNLKVASATDPGSITASHVDNNSGIVITTTSGLITLTLPAPTNTTASRFFAIEHKSTSVGTLKVNGIQIGVTSSLLALWDGVAWVFIGGNTGGGATPAAGQFISVIDDFLNADISATVCSSLRWTVTSSGTGTPVAAGIGEVNHPGVYILSVGNNGRVALSLGTDSILLGGGELTFDWVVSLGQLSDAAQEFGLMLGLGDQLTTADQTDGIYFEYDRPTSVNWRICTASNNTRTKTTTSVPVVDAGTWVKLSAIINIPANTITYLINDVSVGTISTNIPSGAGRTLGPLVRLRKIAGNVDKTMSLDLFRFSQALTVPR